MELEEVLNLVGAYGRYQVLLWLLMAMMDSWTSSWHMLVMTFIGYEPTHHCKAADNLSLPVNMTFPMNEDGGEKHIAKCRMYINFTDGNQTEACFNGWWYDRDVMKSSIVTEWDLVCDKNYLAETSQSVYMAGLFAGGCLMGMLSDRWGRKKIMFIGFGAQAVSGVVASVSPNLYMFMVFRFIVGMFVVGSNLTGFIVACELFPTKQRSIFGTLHELQWSVGGGLLPLIAFLLRHYGWRYIQLAISLPSLLTFLTWKIVPESVPWLISKGRLSDAEKILERAAKFNGRKLPERCLHKNHEKQPEVTASLEFMTPWKLFKTPQLRKITLCASLFWFANVFVYYGLSQNSVNLSGDIYMNFFLMFAVEVPSLALSVFLLYTFGEDFQIDIDLLWAESFENAELQNQTGTKRSHCEVNDDHSSKRLATSNNEADMTPTMSKSVSCGPRIDSTMESTSDVFRSSGQSDQRPQDVADIDGCASGEVCTWSDFFESHKGRKYPTGALYLFCGVACIVLPFIPQKTAGGTDIAWVTVMMALIGKFSINAAFTMSMVYIVELYPTVIRATGFTFTNIFGRLGGVIYPYILYLNKKEELGNFRLSLPYLIFGSVAIGAALQVFLLPETRGRTLPETIEDVEGESAFKKITKTKNIEVNDGEIVLEVKHSPADKYKGKGDSCAARDNQAFEVV